MGNVNDIVITKHHKNEILDRNKLYFLEVFFDKIMKILISYKFFEIWLKYITIFYSFQTIYTRKFVFDIEI